MMGVGGLAAEDETTADSLEDQEVLLLPGAGTSVFIIAPTWLTCSSV